MLQRCDAALIIGDPALFLDERRRRLRKIDLGEEWTAMTGLPFVWAFWAGRSGALAAERPPAPDRRAGRRRRRIRRIADDVLRAGTGPRSGGAT